MTGPRRVGDILTPAGSPLAALVRGAQDRHQMDAWLGEFLDSPLRDHVHAGGGDDGVLVLVADTPVWGHRVRYMAPAILEQLRTHEPSLREVRIVVRPLRTEPDAPPARSARSLSKSAASLLERVAATCDNPKLARILARLGARGR